MKRGIFFLALFLLIIGGCSYDKNQNENNTEINEEQTLSEQELVDICIAACENEKTNKENLEDGPCLLDPIEEDNKWVCDVAHDPRQDTDNLAENQCKAYRDRIANHFIEVTPDCRLIRAI